MSDPYDVLGVGRDADAATVKSAWRRAARAHHPDRGGDPEAFAQASAAWELLADPLRRRFYDRFGQDPHDLGLEGAALRQALKVRLKGERPPKRPPRAECPVCEGTGIRPSGRVCTTCDPRGAPAPQAGPDWDPTADAGRRVRVGRRTRPKPAPTFFVPDPPKPERVTKPEAPKSKAGRFRLRRDDDG